MNQTVQILLKFSDHLEISNPINYMFRIIGWLIINGLVWLVDSLSNVTDSILKLKLFFTDNQIHDLIDLLKPLSITLMAFSLLYLGYLIMFQKKVNREAIVVNIFMALVVFTILGTGMEKTNKFTDQAIEGFGISGTQSIAIQIVKDNITDVSQYDLTNWETVNLDKPNKIPKDNILNISITEPIDKDFQFDNKKELSQNGQYAFENKLSYGDSGTPKEVELDKGLFTFDENYYRWDWNFWTIAITLGVMAFTMVTIAIKLAKLFFELTFNYVLATIIAPADIHSGQKTKQVIQNILNIFITTIMIFMSLKIYTIGTGFITQKLDGIAYVIALFSFSLAVVDGPNIVERLFGIDAGLKSGWGALAGAYGVAKGMSKGVNGITSLTKSLAQGGANTVASMAGATKGLSSNQMNLSTNQNFNGTMNNQNDLTQNSKDDKQINQTNNEQASLEANAGMGQVASSLEQEMDQQQAHDNPNQPIGLHEEMNASGVNTPSSEMENQPGQLGGESSPTGLHEEMNASGDNSLTSQMECQVGSVENASTNGLHQEMDKENSIASVRSDEQSNVQSGLQKEMNNSQPAQTTSNHLSSSVRTNEPMKNSSVSSNQNGQQISPGSANSRKPMQETRHVGQVIRDRFTQEKPVQSVQRSYKIGENTGSALRNSIANYRDKHRNSRNEER
ncbi:pLS20_p028 family conjugation system transmembrane protein [Gottfriedia sp. NPDC056225]|uniref:pLS20_p028 family conjugation system transmembrane protein n=1 Tax=Gottfriedia sp. NPDC056225 TaxID=3345751 RepID=UPI0035E1D419